LLLDFHRTATKFILNNGFNFNEIYIKMNKNDINKTRINTSVSSNIKPQKAGLCSALLVMTLRPGEVCSPSVFSLAIPSFLYPKTWNFHAT
jgi:hypothetical protein